MSRIKLGPNDAISFVEGVKLKNVEMSVSGGKYQVELDLEHRIVIINETTWTPFENVKYGVGAIPTAAILTGSKKSG